MQDEPLRRVPVIGVMGSGSEPHAERAEPLGRWIAEHSAHLLTGGGAGVMAAVSAAFCRVRPRRGLCIGVLPARDANDATPPPGYPNPWVELAIRTHLHQRGTEGDQPHSRNHINLLSSDAIVLLPGGPGTASEARLAMRYGRRALAWCASTAERSALPAGILIVSTFEALARELSSALAAAEHG